MRRLLVLVLPLSLALAACGSTSEAEGGASDKLNVVVTTPQLEDFARNIGGDSVTVRNVLRPGVDPHDFEASPADIEAIRKADVVVRNGAGLESWFDSTVRSSGTQAEIVDASDNVKLRKDDPHIWQSPVNAEVMVNNITNALQKASPDHSKQFDEARNSYNAQLAQLDRDVAAQISALPDKRMVTDHDAFGYYIDRYDMTFVGSVIPSFDSQADLSSQDINDLVNKIRATGTKAIFVEQTLSPKTAITVGREANVRVVSGDDSLYADTFADSGEASTYIGVVRHNTKVIVDNLR